MKRLACLPFLSVLIYLAGCTAVGPTPTPPTAAEQYVFNIQTNYVPVVVLKTNFIPQQVDVVVPLTNVVGQVVFQTNVTVVQVQQVVQATNQQPVYTMTPSAGTTSTINAIGATTNLAAPGIGSLVGAGLTALVGLWGYLRSYKPAVNTNSALVQEIATIRQFVQALPNGDVYDAAVTKFLSDHQNDAGVATTVASLLESEISNGDALVAASQVIATIQALYAQKAGVAATAAVAATPVAPLPPMAVKL